MRHRSIRSFASLATFVAVLSCSADGVAPPTSTEAGVSARWSDSTLLAGLTVSGPVANTIIASDRSAANASATVSPEVSWVSMVPGTVYEVPGTLPDGATATITNLRTAERVTVPVVDGGFDPQPVSASVGDRLQVTVNHFLNADQTVVLSVAARPAPRVVRTRPPRGQTDAPLNTVIIIVFSEPLDPASVNNTSVTLSAGASPVAGEVHVVPGPGYAVEFTPSALLVPVTTYTLTVTGVVNLAGTPIAAPTAITFTTGGSSSSSSLSSVTISPDPASMNVGSELQLTATVTDATGQVVKVDLHDLYWESSAPDVASVYSVAAQQQTTVTAIGTGTVVITARSVYQGRTSTGTARITVNPAPTPIGAIATKIWNDLGGLNGLYALNPDGSNGRLLTSNEWDRDPVWSPDGRSIAFRSQRACGGSRFCLTDLYVMKADGSGIGADGSGLRSLTKGRGLQVGGISWSPDGSRIVFAAGALTPDLLFNESLYVINADGSGLRLLLSGPPGGSASSPDWSPDGGKIAYTVVLGDTSAIHVVNADGSNDVRLNGPSAFGGDFGPRWSPDGKRIAFTRLVNGATSQVFVMNADGSNVTQITYDSKGAGYPEWSPDGTRLALSAGALGGSGVMNADGTGGRAIPAPCCGSEFFMPFSWRRTAAAVPASVR